VATATDLTALWHCQPIPGWLALLCSLGRLGKDLVLYSRRRNTNQEDRKIYSMAPIGTRVVALEKL